MYGISYEKCLFLLFLVVLAVVCCSGFRIDNLTMTDISKRNSRPPPTSVDLPPLSEAPHRIRHHHRQPRAHPQPAKRNRRKNRNTCQRPDVTYKAFVANTVVVARTEAVSVVPPDQNYSVLFRVINKLKYPSRVIIDDHIRLKFSNDSDPTRCDSDNPSSLVKANIRQNRNYILFLNAYGAHNYTVFGRPELHNNRLPQPLQKVLRPKFKPRKFKLVLRPIHNRRKELRLECRIKKALPVPLISWSRNGQPLHPSRHLRITYRITQTRKKSVLLIRQPSESDRGHYECTAHVVFNKTVSNYYDFNPPSVYREPCDPIMSATFCDNGGKCSSIPKIKEYYCECPEGYNGVRCQNKIPSQSSRYRPSSESVCKLGLNTKLYC